MKKLLAIVGAALVSTPTLAASVIATPALKPPSGGSIHCYIANSSPTKDIQVQWSIDDFEGTDKFTATSTLNPLHNTMSGSNITTQSSCVVKVLKGSKANVRVTLAAHDGSGNIVTAVQGQ